MSGLQGGILNDQTLERLLAPHPRVRSLRSGHPSPGRDCIVYWMQRAQRGIDNPALNLAIAVGNAVAQPVLAVFALTADYPGAQRRHYRFLVEGLRDAEADLAARGVPLVVRLGSPAGGGSRLRRGSARLARGRRREPGAGRPGVAGAGGPKARGALSPGGRRRGGADLALPQGRVRGAHPPSQDSSRLARVPQAASQPAGSCLVEGTTAGRRGHRPRRPDGQAEGRRGRRGPGLSAAARARPCGGCGGSSPSDWIAMPRARNEPTSLLDHGAVGPPALRPHQPA